MARTTDRSQSSHQTSSHVKQLPTAQPPPPPLHEDKHTQAPNARDPRDTLLPNTTLLYKTPLLLALSSLLIFSLPNGLDPM